jgi:hypothetical protein
MPDWLEAGCTHYQMYEVTTEGTPISPVMETPEALACWFVDNNVFVFGNIGTSYDEWLAAIRGKAVILQMWSKEAHYRHHIMKCY